MNNNVKIAGILKENLKKAKAIAAMKDAAASSKNHFLPAASSSLADQARK